MKLRDPRPTGDIQSSYQEVRQQAVDRVEHRYEADLRRARAIQRRLKLIGYAKFLLLVLVLGGGYRLWQSGMLDAKLREFGLEALAHGSESDVQPSALISGTTVPEADVEAAVEKAVARYQGTKPAGVPVSASTTSTGASLSASPVAPDRDAWFAGASVDYWKNARPEDRPTKAQALLFHGIVPDGQGGSTLLELKAGGSAKMSVCRLDPDGTSQLLLKSDFDKLIAEHPYLVVREGRAYLCEPGKGLPSFGKVKVPAVDEAFNPARHEFGALYPLLKELKVKSPSMQYTVTLELPKYNRKLTVATVAAGEAVSHEMLVKVVREKIVDDAESAAVLLKTGFLTVSQP